VPPASRGEVHHRALDLGLFAIELEPKTLAVLEVLQCV